MNRILFSFLLAALLWLPLHAEVGTGAFKPGDSIQPEPEKNGTASILHYEVLSSLGHGSFATVYRVKVFQGDTLVGEKALKLIRVPEPGEVRADPHRELGYDKVTAISDGKPPASLVPYNPAKTIVQKHTPNGPTGAKYRAIEMDIAEASARSSIAEFTVSPKLTDAEYAVRLDRIERFLEDGVIATKDLAALSLHHGDLKPGNFLKMKDVAGVEHWKVGDLDGVSAIGETAQFNLIVASPEQLGSRSTTASDTFTLAGTTYELFFGHAPAFQYLVGHTPGRHLPRSNVKLREALVELYKSDEKQVDFRTMIESSFRLYETRFPAQAERTRALKRFTLAALEVDPQRRIDTLAALPLTKEWAEEARGFRLDFKVFHQICAFGMKMLGLGRRDLPEMKPAPALGNLPTY